MEANRGPKILDGVGRRHLLACWAVWSGLTLTIRDRIVRISGTFDDKGVTGTAGVVAAIAFVPVVGFFTTGTSAKIPTGSAVKAFLDEDVAFRPVAAQPQVIDVPPSGKLSEQGTLAFRG